MATTSKRIHLALTAQDIKELKELEEELKESKNQILRRALQTLHFITFEKLGGRCYSHQNQKEDKEGEAN